MDIKVNDVTITLTPEHLKQIDTELKKMRQPDKPTPEERFWQLCEGLEMKINRKYPETIVLLKNNEFWFDYNIKTGVLLISWKYVWSIFEVEYAMEYGAIRKLIKYQVENHFKIKGVTPSGFAGAIGHWVETHFKKLYNGTN